MVKKNKEKPNRAVVTSVCLQQGLLLEIKGL
jgi:hypothetical protein